MYAFLAEKERRSGSQRTVESYSRMLQDFFGRLGTPPDRVTSQDVFTYAHGIGLGEAAIVGHCRRSSRVRVVLLSVPDSHGRSHFESVRCASIWTQLSDRRSSSPYNLA